MDEICNPKQYFSFKERCSNHSVDLFSFDFLDFVYTFKIVELGIRIFIFTLGFNETERKEKKEER